ncbi:tail fiber protein [Photobacterium sp. CCB-ST2H9]|uniref:phage tail protein n=1 Tax=unclassified Photobacterium TaxID=2628852 RepID=UPI002002ECBA|nr:tail fiber protein [Photobacterium sp. CCB-ST2H9]UTM58325.1 tail fiber protein [Photobacterium sp. CCB-ST2H9]
MSEAFYGEIMMMPYNYAPRYWAVCYGQKMSTVQNQALFSVIQNIFGPWDPNYFYLPDLRGRVPMGAGRGPGLTPYQIGNVIGSDQVSLTDQQIPPHTHQLSGTFKPGSTDVAQGAVPGLLTDSITVENRYSTGDVDTKLNLGSLDMAGQSLPHENMQPYLAINFCICIDGVYPVRS